MSYGIVVVAQVTLVVSLVALFGVMLKHDRIAGGLLFFFVAVYFLRASIVNAQNAGFALRIDGVARDPQIIFANTVAILFTVPFSVFELVSIDRHAARWKAIASRLPSEIYNTPEEDP